MMHKKKRIKNVVLRGNGGVDYIHNVRNIDPTFSQPECNLSKELEY